MYPVKQSTALTVPFFVHDVAGDAVTGLADGTFTKRISKNGAGFAAMTVTISEMENGWYSIPLSSSHSDTLGILSITFTNASAKQVNLQYRVHAALPDDIKAETVLILADTADIQPKIGTPAADVSADIAAVKAETALIVADTNELQTDDVPGLIAALNNVAATDIVSAGAITTLAGAVVNVDLVDTTTVNTDMRGTDSALLAASAPSNFGDLAITVTTGLVSVGTMGTGSIVAATFGAGAIDNAAFNVTETLTANPAAGGITAASFGAGAVDAAALAADAATEIADALLNRDMSAVTVTNTRSPINAFRFLRNKWSIAAATLTVTEEDDLTTAWTSALTTDGAANPITASDPA
jgi:hypothetical protein